MHVGVGVIIGGLEVLEVHGPRVAVAHVYSDNLSLSNIVAQANSTLFPLMHVVVIVILGSLGVLVEHGPRVVVEHMVSSACLFARFGISCGNVVQETSTLFPLIHVGIGIGACVIGKSEKCIGETMGINIRVAEEVDVEQGVWTTVLVH
jgi:hypothetical protein